MAQSILDAVAGQTEKVEQDVRILTANGNTISDRVVTGDAFKIEGNRRAAVVPIQTTLPMSGYKMNLNGGTFGRGRGIEATSYKLAHLPFAYSFELTIESATMNNANAINLTEQITGKSALVASEWQDVFFHQPGDGILAGRDGGSTTSTVTVNSISRTQYVFADPNDNTGVSMLVEGMQVEVYSSDLDTRRSPASGTELTFIIAIDPNSRAVTLSQEIASAAAGDVLAIAGLKNPAAGFPFGFGRGASPALASFSSTYPANGTTNAAGFQGDAFRHGYSYATDPDTTRSFYTLSKAAVPQLLPAVVNAGAPYNQSFMIQLQAQLINKRPQVNALNELAALVPLAQWEAIWRAGVTLVQPMQDVSAGSSISTLDGSPKEMSYEDTFRIGGVICHKDRRQPANQIDLIAPKQIGKCVGAELQLLKQGTQNGFSLVTDTTTGVQTSMLIMHMFDSWDYGYKDPGMFGTIRNLQKPAGY